MLRQARCPLLRSGIFAAHISQRTISVQTSLLPLYVGISTERKTGQGLPSQRPLCLCLRLAAGMLAGHQAQPVAVTAAAEHANPWCEGQAGMVISTAQTARSEPIVAIFTTLGCGYCKRTKDALKSAGIDFQDIDLSNHVALLTKVKAATGHHTVPQVPQSVTAVRCTLRVLGLSAGRLTECLL